jgi:8-oxo-dGTP pyrophosphatase MutT (NUDIX family)
MQSSVVHRSVDLLFFDVLGRVLLQFRDGDALSAPLTWGFWGGQVDAGDTSIEYAAAREAYEELTIELDAADFTRCGLRVGSNGGQAYLLRCHRTVGWRDIDIREGSGAAFFTVSELRQVSLTKAVRFYLERQPELFSR